MYEVHSNVTQTKSQECGDVTSLLRFIESIGKAEKICVKSVEKLQLLDRLSNVRREPNTR